MSFADHSVPNNDKEETKDEFDERYSLNPSYFDILKQKEEEDKAELTLIQQQIKKERLEINQKIKNSMPHCFDADRFFHQSEKYYHQKGKIVLYVTLGKYVEAGAKFYSQALHTLATKSGIIDKMPFHVQVCGENEYNLEQTKQEFKQLEKSVISLVALIKNQNMKQFLKTQVNLTEFVHYMAQTWMIYFDVNKNNLLNGLINIQNLYSTTDLTNQDEITKFYAAKTRVEVSINPFFKDMFTKNGTMLEENDYIAPYSTIGNINQVYQDLLKTIGGFNSVTAKHELEEKLPLVTNPLNKDIIYIHDNYQDVYTAAGYLRNIDPNDPTLNYADYWSYEEDKMNRDLYQTVLNYYNVCKNCNDIMPENKTYKRIKKTMTSMQTACAESLNIHYKAYNNYQEQSKKFKEEYSKTNSIIAMLDKNL